MGARSKGSDEVFCRSCGEPIKRTAEICHHCGVRNAARDSVEESPPLKRSRHDPAMYDTTVSGNWYYVLIVGMVLRVFTGMYNGTGLLMEISVLAAWVFPPVGFFLDSKYVRANSLWHPGIGWTLAGLIPFVTLIAGVVYLYRRHTFLGVP